MKMKIKRKCANCDRIIGKEDTKYFGNDGKVLCSSQCVDTYNKDNTKNPKACSVLRKGYCQPRNDFQ